MHIILFVKEPKTVEEANDLLRDRLERLKDIQSSIRYLKQILEELGAKDDSQAG